MSWKNLNNLSVSLHFTKLMKDAKVTSCLWSFLWCFLPALCFHVHNQVQQTARVPKYINFTNAGRVYRLIFSMAGGFSSKLKYIYNSNGPVLHDSFKKKRKLPGSPETGKCSPLNTLDWSKHFLDFKKCFSNLETWRCTFSLIFNQFIMETHIVAQYGMLKTNSQPLQSQQQG